jgi:hypothetical protein
MVNNYDGPYYERYFIIPLEESNIQIQVDEISELQ